MADPRSLTVHSILRRLWRGFHSERAGFKPRPSFIPSLAGPPSGRPVIILLVGTVLDYTNVMPELLKKPAAPLKRQAKHHTNVTEFISFYALISTLRVYPPLN